jgi:pilus assembly protein CpaE
LGRDVAYTIGNDFALVRTAIDRGIPLTEVKRKSLIVKDLDVLDGGISAALGLERY